MAEEDQLKRMVMTFRVSELQMLLGTVGRNKTGRKNELQSRAIDMVKFGSPVILQKIRDLYKGIQHEMRTFGDRTQLAGNQSNLLPSSRMPSSINSASVHNQPGIGSTYGSVSSAPQVYGSRSSNNQSHYNLPNSTFYMPNTQRSYQVNPEVTLKKLPFFDILADLIKPSTLASHGSGKHQEAAFPFVLTTQQANKIAQGRDLRTGKQDYLVQVQVRFCLLESNSEQDDSFPASITVKFNDKPCPLPNPIPTNKVGVEPKRPSRPVNITAFCKISPYVKNRLLVTWGTDYGKCHVISVYLVKKLTSEELLNRLKDKGPQSIDYTKSLIIQKLKDDNECEIATTALRCSLHCPLGKMRMVLPCRAETCQHLQCFDASLYIQMNERKPTWTCPVCDKPAVYDNLVVDGYFQDILQTSNTCSEVTLNADGSWTPVVAQKESKEQMAEKKKSEFAVETLSDDENNDCVVEGISAQGNGKRKAAEIDIVMLSDNEEDQPPAKKAATTNMTTRLSSKNHNSHPTSGSAAVDISESSNSNNSWHVGEVDHGKRLVFRKAPGTTNGNTSSTNNGYASAAGPASPQIICLDSPMPSPPLSVSPAIGHGARSSSNALLSLLANQSASGSGYAGVTPTGLSNDSIGYPPIVAGSSISPYLLTDPFAPSLLPPAAGLPLLFEPPLGMNFGGQSSSQSNSGVRPP